MPVSVNPRLVAYHLRTYGENDVAEKVEAMSDEAVRSLGEVTGRVSRSVDPKTPWPKIVSLAAIEVVEGVPRDLRLKRRRRVDSALGPGEGDWFVKFDPD